MYMTQGLHRAVQRRPHAIAVRFGDRQRTFIDFAGRVARLAGALQALGMQAGDRVAMLALNSDRYLEYQMAVPWGGGVLNPCNIRWNASEIAYSLNDSGSTILIVDEAFKAMAGLIKDKAISVRELVYAGEEQVPAGMHGYEALIAAADAVPDAGRRGEDLAAVFYTGGTTGFPKGVMLSHNNVCISGLTVRAEGLVGPQGTSLHVAPMFHIADFGVAMADWVEGNTHAIVPSFDSEKTLDALARHRVTHLVMVPTMLQMMVDHPAMKVPRDLSALKRVLLGGSPISETVLDRAIAALPGVAFQQGYGMTETAPVCTVSPPDSLTAAGRQSGKFSSAGRAACCVEMRIVDADGHEVARGTVGEVVVRGPNVMQGYWNKPAETAAALRNGWLHTGDGATMDQDGYVYIVDRLKDMIISGGENVYSVEVENAIAKHPSVLSSAVIGVPDDRWGERVHAVVVCRPGAELTAEALTAHCKTLISGYKCPRSAEFADALPLSGAGKVLKSQLRQPYWEGRHRRVA
jgi:acyl-CoA synthetase (AMP-forming)/AMP-acid ligase II